MERKTKKSVPTQPDAAAKTPPTIGDVMNSLETAIYDTQTLFGDIVLSTAEKRRLNGPGVRRYGFIDKTMDYSGEFSQFAPLSFDRARLVKAKENIEYLRDAQILVDRLGRLLSDVLLVNGEAALNEALLYYTSVREQAKRNVPGANELYDRLKLLFMKRKSPESPETEKQLLRDARKLIEGRADGEMLIKNVKPHSEGGVHEVIDELHKGHVEEEIKIGANKK
jgi:hypothetical protein